MSATWTLVWLVGGPGWWDWTRASTDGTRGLGGDDDDRDAHFPVLPSCQHCPPLLSWSPEELSLSGLCQCLVELSTQPATVCHGSATTREAARGEAARRALQYLKIMAGSK